MPISDQVMRDLRDVVRATAANGDVAAMNDAERLVFRVLPSLLDEIESLREPRMIAEVGLDAALRASVYPVDRAHTVRVLRLDGSERIECDHEFVGAPNCVHCGKPFADLQRESRTERRSLEAGVDVVSIALGPVLRARVDEIVKTNRLGSTLAHVAQTLFVLGLLDAEGQDPRAHFGEPKQHVSVDGVFVRFALPHEVGDEARREILRTLYAWLHAWLGDDEPLQRTASAALEALPR